jgi:hypothetical protein
MPEPLRWIVSEALLALLVNVTLPVTFPTAAGAKVTFNVADCPDPMMAPAGMPLTLKPGPETATFSTVILVLREFVTVSLRALTEPTATLPKFNGEIVASSPSTAAFEFAEALVAIPTHPDWDIAKNKATNKIIEPKRHMMIKA